MAAPNRLSVPMCWPQTMPRGTDQAGDGVIHPGLAFSPEVCANGVGLSVRPECSVQDVSDQVEELQRA